MTHYTKRIFVFALLILQAFTAFAREEHIPNSKGIRINVLMYEEHLGIIQPLNTADCVDEMNYSGGNQILNEWKLLCQALAVGGIQATFNLQPIPNLQRAVKELHRGDAILIGFTTWRRYFDNSKHHMSEPTIKRGEFLKALYTHRDNADRLSHLTLPSLLKVSALVNSEWSVDVEAMSCFENRYETGITYPKMLKMVHDQKVEVLLHNLSHRGSLVHSAMDVELVPVHGTLISMPDSLHYLVNANHPDGKKIAMALEKGLRQLTDDKTVYEAYTSAGFFSPVVKDWRVVKCVD